MSNPLYDAMKGKPATAQNPMHMISQLKNDPAAFLKSRGFNVPNEVDIHNPQSIIEGLFKSGQVNGGRYQQAIQILKSLSGGR